MFSCVSASEDLVLGQGRLPGIGMDASQEELQRPFEDCVFTIAGKAGKLADVVKKRRRMLLMADRATSEDTAQIQVEATVIHAYRLKLGSVTDFDLKAAYRKKMQHNENLFSQVS